MIIDRLELIIIRRLLLRVEKGMEICVVIKQMCRNNLELARFISVVSERRSDRENEKHRRHHSRIGRAVRKKGSPLRMNEREGY